MSDPNKHIYDYLNYYCSMSSAPEFGVLLKGEWGSGKTWFINKFIEEKKEIKTLYVSLYGITAFSEIEEEFFRQLHPRLSSKGMRLTGKILKGLLKTTIKVDLDQDGKDDDAVASQVPDINLPEYLTDIDNCILIFDDLERCKIDVENVLGYINHFVEHQGFKVIILAHEEELEKRADNLGVAYKIIKEKLIGKTFQITPHLESALDDFISKLESSVAKQFLLANKAQITEVYSQSKLENLRVLKQSLWDFERIYEALPEKAKGKEELVQKILSLSLAFSLETRAGKLSFKDILQLKPDWLTGGLFGGDGKKAEEKTPTQIFVEKYKKFEPQRPIPSGLFWSEYLGKGVIDRGLLDQSINNSSFFVSDNTPNWVRLWHFAELQDDEFTQTLSSVQGEFDRREFVQIGELSHVVGTFLWLSEIGLFSLRKNQIVKSAMQYVDFLKSKNLLPEDNGDLISSITSRTGYVGLGFHGNDMPEFQSFLGYVRKVQQITKEEGMPQAADELVEIMKLDSRKFFRMVTLSNSEDQIYFNTPILKYADATKFVAKLLDVPPKDRRFVAYALEERYKLDLPSAKLVEELAWLKKVNRLLKAEIAKRKSQLSGYALGYIVSTIEEAINKLKPGPKVVASQ
ncbi:MAG: P-loop NTPase fold protein [Sideroxyarcus sp.]|nr:P-loop NTPase fold protein [Sideroxyarcus sp.]